MAGAGLAFGSMKMKPQKSKIFGASRSLRRNAS